MPITIKQGMSLLKLAEEIIKEANRPLSSKEIWEIAETQNARTILGLKGRTVAATIGARIYVDIRDNKKSVFERVNTPPVQFYLNYLPPYQPPQSPKAPQTTSPKYLEKDLHPLLSYYVNNFYSIYTKTIPHIKSTKKAFAQWQHPDIVGVFYPMKDLDESVADVVNHTGKQRVKFFSYELKRELNFKNLRVAFFQTVSNSSWANESYLVTAKIDDSEEFMEEISRLSNSFGIGVILLNVDNPDDCAIILNARQKDVVDIQTMNKLAQLNPNFRHFLSRIKKDLDDKRTNADEKFDEILGMDKLIAKYK